MVPSRAYSPFHPQLNLTWIEDQGGAVRGAVDLAVLVIGNRPDYNAIMLESKSADEILFDVETPLGFRVRTTIGCWELIARIKHPVVRGRQEDIQETLRRPARCEQACQMRRSIYSIALMEPSAGCVR